MARVELAHSARRRPEGEAVGRPDDGARLAVTLHLRHPAEPDHAPGSAEDFAALAVPTTRRRLALERARLFAPARAPLAEFAAQHGLRLGRLRATRRTVKLYGAAAQLSEAFGATLVAFEAEGRRFRARTGPLTAPDDLAPWIRAVVGFDTRAPSLRPASDPTDGLGLWPREIAALYGLPADAKATGQCIGVIAPGGGHLPTDLAAAAAGAGQVPPTAVVDQPASANRFGQDDLADAELAIDLQVLAGVAAGAKLVAYFTGGHISDLAGALHDAVFDTVNRPQVLCVSWGSSEDVWPDDVRLTVQAALRDAVRLKVAVVAAAGDYLATGGFTDGKAHVYHPASSPYVLACGGTAPTLDAAGARIVGEAVWNDGLAATGTGGGISDKHPVPAYQAALALPPSANAGAPAGRGVPDVAAAASALPGYSVILNGQRIGKAGTSAATPLWAALLALANARRASPLGLPHDVLYGAAGVCREITAGDNRYGGLGYDAGPGWNACTGLGVPNIAQVLDALAAAP